MDSLHGVTTKESRTPGHYNYCRDCSCWIPIRRLVLGPVLHHRKSETPVPCSSKQWKKDWGSSHLPLASLQIPFAISCSAYWDFVGMSAATAAQRSLLLILKKTPSTHSQCTDMHTHVEAGVQLWEVESLLPPHGSSELSQSTLCPSDALIDSAVIFKSCGWTHLLHRKLS